MSNPIEFPPYPRDPESIRGRAYAAQVLREAADAIEGVWEGIEESGQPYTPAMAAGQLRARAADLESPNCFSCMAPHSKRYPAEPVGVSDEAVEAAAKHFQQFILNSPSWEDETKKHLWRECSRAALEAAAPFLQPQVVASLPAQRQLDGWLSDHEKVYHGELGDRCACGWRPDSWESEDEFDEYFRDHRSAAVLALMGGAEDETK